MTGEYWDDKFEACLDKGAKFSPNNRSFFNFSAWNPKWQAECWRPARFELAIS